MNDVHGFVLRWSLIASWPRISTSWTTFPGGAEDTQGHHGNSTTHVGRNSRTISGTVSSECKSLASTPLKKQMLQKKRRGSAEFYNQSQLEEKAGPVGLLNRMSWVSGRTRMEPRCPASCPAVSRSNTDPHIMSTRLGSSLTCNTGPSYIVSNKLTFLGKPKTPLL